MKLKRGKKKMTYTYNRKGITRKVLSELSVALGQRSKYWLDKDFAFVRDIWYDTRYAQDGRQRRYGVSQS